MLFGRWAALMAIVVAGSPAAWAQQITESFTSSEVVANNTVLGQCNQLKARLAGNGGITVAGNGHAAVSTPAAADAAMIHSAAPLPSGGYKVSVEVTKIYYTQYTVENGVTLLTIANTTPQPATEGWWNNHRTLGVEVSVLPGSPNLYPIYVNYWDNANNMYTWSGTQWGVGDPAWLPVLTFDPQKTYTVEIEKAGNLYTIRVLSGGATLTQATVPVSSVRSSPVEYSVTGDRITNYFRGTMQINAVTMPAPPGCPPPDAGVPDGPLVQPDGPPVQPDGPAVQPDGPLIQPDGPLVQPDGPLVQPDGPLVQPDGPAVQPDGPAVQPDGGIGDGPGDLPSSGETTNPSWDLYTPDVGPVSPPDEGCSCRLARGRAPSPLPWLVMALVLLVLWRRRPRS